uniref:Uncharacterized protein n=1 Tax=Alexandrium catenella TaxID=2925 RepID=A0A7S1L351_ALECA|mmetsp:Transcript_105182/g.279963  ORF Transcript_105182/g.279963 Transcript_105182/m.279963 type:complete len:273 (+) Transcript_105182:72-890(+)
MGWDGQARAGPVRRLCTVGFAAALAPQAVQGVRSTRAGLGEHQANASTAGLPEPGAGFLSRNATSGTSNATSRSRTLDTVSLYNIMMCWERVKVAEDPCEDWMVEQCKTGVTGEGYCRKLKDLVAKDCDSGKASACSRAVQLGVRTAQAAPPTASAAAPAAPSAAPLAAPAPAPASAPTGIDKVWETLPAQGFDESAKGSVKLDDMAKSSVKDWGAEWPRTGKSEEEAVAHICEEQPSSHTWCKLYLEDLARRSKKESWWQSWWQRWFGWLW